VFEHFMMQTLQAKLFKLFMIQPMSHQSSEACATNITQYKYCNNLNKHIVPFIPGSDRAAAKRRRAVAASFVGYATVKVIHKIRCSRRATVRAPSSLSISHVYNNG
jgi:hypothetical protein